MSVFGEYYQAGNAFMKYFLTLLLSLTCFIRHACAQAELTPWGNITGIRKDGQLFRFETSLQYIKSDGIQILATARERQRPQYHREGSVQIVNTSLDHLQFTERVTNTGSGKAQIDVELTSGFDIALTGAYFTVRLPYPVTGNHTLTLAGNKVNLQNLSSGGVKGLTGTRAKNLEFKTAGLQFHVETETADSLIIRKDYLNGVEGIMIYFPLQSGSIKKGETIRKTYFIQATGAVDKQPVTLTLNTAQQGRPFEGLGGNFRLQNSATDPQVIDYSLNNLRVAWGRVELPWRLWQPGADVKPENSAPAPEVVKAMEMAQRLDKLGIPLVLSAWTAPDWAITPAGYL